MQEEFEYCILTGETSKVAVHLRNPKINVNKKELKTGYTPLHNACFFNRTEIARLLLRHPEIKINEMTKLGFTPFQLCCIDSSEEPSKLLLADERTKLNWRNRWEPGPLYHLVLFKNTKMIELWMASGRELDYGDPIGPFCALKEARKTMMIHSLLCDYRNTPKETIWRLKIKHGHLEREAARFFAVVVFRCDGLLKDSSGVFLVTRVNALRFLKIAARLPLELQAILCRRAAGSSLDGISSKVKEDAFRELARKLN
jgi:hypothetical protein